jgi:hypothetical protein
MEGRDFMILDFQGGNDALTFGRFAAFSKAPPKNMRDLTVFQQGYLSHVAARRLGVTIC